ncbi:MAG: hypothetical protein JETT_3519 [Candidatus Jettenia ecosi]|uniref:Uncharacterized protein n=1 Tax=Candidatus Jettenia ecosi TaxID=2494326 RepID=A0A533QC71_9BACT|nr:MAG: hypothetical protein JETT_3519 [Candidatus Jettenia ecosi]
MIDSRVVNVDNSICFVNDILILKCKIRKVSYPIKLRVGQAGWVERE